MTDATKATIKARVEEAIAEATDVIGPLPARTGGSPGSVALPEGLCWALVNVADTRQVFVDDALRRIGGGTFVVEVDDDGARIVAGVEPG